MSFQLKILKKIWLLNPAIYSQLIKNIMIKLSFYTANTINDQRSYICVEYSSLNWSVHPQILNHVIKH